MDQYDALDPDLVSSRLPWSARADARYPRLGAVDLHDGDGKLIASFDNLTKRQNEENAALAANAVNDVAKLKAALTLIASFKGKTLISATGESYETGANRAFDQCAEIAIDALDAA